MHIRSLYLDTSVIGGYHDTEWMVDTRELWQQAQAGQWRRVTSIVAEAELQNAPANVRREDGFNAVNLLHGWPAVRIVSPKEIIYAHENQPE